MVEEIQVTTVSALQCVMVPSLLSTSSCCPSHQRLGEGIILGHNGLGKFLVRLRCVSLNKSIYLAFSVPIMVIPRLLLILEMVCRLSSLDFLPNSVINSVFRSPRILHFDQGLRYGRTGQASGSQHRAGRVDQG